MCLCNCVFQTSASCKVSGQYQFKTKLNSSLFQSSFSWQTFLSHFPRSRLMLSSYGYIFWNYFTFTTLNFSSLTFSLSLSLQVYLAFTCFFLRRKGKMRKLERVMCTMRRRDKKLRKVIWTENLLTTETYLTNYYSKSIINSVITLGRFLYILWVFFFHEPTLIFHWNS